MDSPDYKLMRATFEYVDSSGSFENLPKPRQEIKTACGKMIISEVLPLCMVGDAGASPFTVRLMCRQG